MQISAAEGRSAAPARKENAKGEEGSMGVAEGEQRETVEIEERRNGLAGTEEGARGRQRRRRRRRRRRRKRKRHEIRNAGINFPGRGTKSILQYPQ